MIWIALAYIAGVATPFFALIAFAAVVGWTERTAYRRAERAWRQRSIAWGLREHGARINLDDAP